MSKIAKKLKRTIVMLLVCSLAASLIPMNTYATENSICHDVEVVTAETTAVEATGKVEETVKGSKGNDTTVSGNTVSENILAVDKPDFTGTENLPIIESTGTNNTSITKSTGKANIPSVKFKGIGNATVTFTDGTTVSENDTSVFVNSGNISFTVSADFGYKIESVSVNGTTCKAENGIYTVTGEKDTTVEINVKKLEYYTVTISQNFVDGKKVVGVVYGDHVRGYEGVNYLTKGEDLSVVLANFDEAKYEVKSVTVNVGGKKLDIKDYSVEDSTYTIAKEKITGDVVVDVVTAAN